MAVITFLSDFGADSHYLASFKGALLQANTPLSFIEITSRIEPFDIVEAAYLSALVYKDFPKNSIHILATNVVATSFDGHLVAAYDGHFFIAPDNGILSLITPPEFNNYYSISTEKYVQKIQTIYVPFIKKLALADFNIDAVAERATQFTQKHSITPTCNENEMRGTVLFVDHFGNAYTNISKTTFDKFTQSKRYRIFLSRFEYVDTISNNFADVKDGNPICYFTDNEKMVIAVKKGSALQLLNLRKYKTITIELK